MRAFAWKSRSSKKTSSPLARGPFATAAFVEKAFGLEGDVVVRRAAGVSFYALTQVELHVVPPADPNVAPRVLHVAYIDGVDAADVAGAEQGEGARAVGAETEAKTARVRFAEVDDVGVAKLLSGRRLLAAHEELARAGWVAGGAADAAVEGGLPAESPDAPAAGSSASVGARTAASTAASAFGALAPDLRGAIGCTVRDERYGELGKVVETIATPANDVWVVRGPRGEVLVPVVDECVASSVPDEAGVLFTHVIDGIVDEEGDGR